MLRIKCPYCGTRDQSEFSFGGENLVPRPTHPEQLSDAQWANYQFYRDNPKGLHFERWVHQYGCRQWFSVIRDTVSHDIVETYRMGEKPVTPTPDRRHRAE